MCGERDSTCGAAVPGEATAQHQLGEERWSVNVYGVYIAFDIMLSIQVRGSSEHGMMSDLVSLSPPSCCLRLLCCIRSP